MASNLGGTSTASGSRLAEEVQATFQSLEPHLANPRILEPKLSPGEKSLQDSGYGTSLPSPDQSEDPDKGKKCANSLPQDAVPFPLASRKDLIVYKKEVDNAAITRFNEIVPEIERLLLAYLKSSGGVFSARARYGPMAIRLMVLGRTESDARECMVVFCPASLCKRVEQFFTKQQTIKDLCDPSDAALQSFKVIVSGHAPRLRVALSDIRVLCASQLSEDTFCGKPLRFVNDLGDIRLATFGGIIKVLNNDGHFKLYGFTAGHCLLDMQDLRAPAKTFPAINLGPHVEDDDIQGGENTEETNEHFQEPEDPFWHAFGFSCKSEQDETVNPWTFTESEELGKVLRNPEDNIDEGQPYFDWALFELNKYLPNVFVTMEALETTRKHTLSLYTRKYSQDASARPVVMMGASEGSKPGVLSKLPGRIILGPGESFVDAYLLTLDGGSVSDGDSGSWVIDPATFEVYGHVVATDMLGDAYVIPLDRTLADIQTFFGAKSVTLPATVDFSIAALEKSSLGSDQLLKQCETEPHQLQKAENGSSETDITSTWMPHGGLEMTYYDAHDVNLDLMFPEFPESWAPLSNGNPSRTPPAHVWSPSSEARLKHFDTTIEGAHDPPLDSGYHTVDRSPEGPFHVFSAPPRPFPPFRTPFDSDFDVLMPLSKRPLEDDSTKEAKMPRLEPFPWESEQS